MKSLKLAAEDTECLSTRLRAKAEALKSLSVNAKSWEGDIKRANKNLKSRIDGSASLQPHSTPKIDISPPQIGKIIIEICLFDECDTFDTFVKHVTSVSGLINLCKCVANGNKYLLVLINQIYKANMI